MMRHALIVLLLVATPAMAQEVPGAINLFNKPAPAPSDGSTPLAPAVKPTAPAVNTYGGPNLFRAPVVVPDTQPAPLAPEPVPAIPQGTNLIFDTGQPCSTHATTRSDGSVIVRGQHRFKPGIYRIERANYYNALVTPVATAPDGVMVHDVPYFGIRDSGQYGVGLGADLRKDESRFILYVPSPSYIKFGPQTAAGTWGTVFAPMDDPRCRAGSVTTRTGS